MLKKNGVVIACLVICVIFWMQSLSVLATTGTSVLINEIMASNSDTIADEDGDYEDWIELYNAGEEVVELTGYYLSDSMDAPLRWQFPTVHIGVEEFLLVWASGKDKVGEEGQLHTDFKISREGEPIILTSPDGETIVDMIAAVPIPRTMSYGRLPDGSDTFVYFGDDNVSPQMSNNQSSPTVLPTTRLLPEFSHERGFYTAVFNLDLTANHPNAIIYYTLDGSDPDPANLDGTEYYIAKDYPNGDQVMRTTKTYVYNEPITIRDGRSIPNDIVSIYTGRGWRAPSRSVFKGVVVRAKVYIDEETFSPTITNTYFVNPRIHERYTLPIVSIVADPIHLFCYEEGFYVPGKIFDTFFDAELPGWQQPGNYSQRGRDWERESHIEFFEDSHTFGFSQNIGLRIHGGASRTRDRKSFRLYARSEYDEQNRFEYDIFPGLIQQAGEGERITNFNRLILRTSGNDSGGTLFRDAMMQRLVDSLDVSKQAYRPVVVFVNGEYWGTKNFRERLDAHYIESHFEVDPDEVVMLYDYHMSGGTSLSVGTEQDVADFVALREYIATNNMQDPLHYDYVATKIDLDNFIEYYAANIYFKNTDWPHNNNQFWRKNTAEYVPDAPHGHDGRWRWMMFDTDFGFVQPEHNTLEWATALYNGRTNEAWPNMILRGLLANDKFRYQFINTLADSMNTVFQSDWVHEIIDEMHRVIQPEITEHVERWNNGGRNPQFMKDFATERPQFVRRHIIDEFKLDGVATVTLNTDPAKGYIRVNSIDIVSTTPGIKDQQSFTGSYFLGVPIEITAIPLPGYEFSGWVGVRGVQEESFSIVLQRDLALFARFEKTN